MKLINQSVEYLPQPEGIIGIYQQIERAARICYKSENKITDDSAKKMVDGLIRAGHNAMLEHGTVYLKATFKGNSHHLGKYLLNKYSNLYAIHHDNVDNTLSTTAYVTTNYRVLVENNWVDDIQMHWCEPLSIHKRRYTFRIVTSIGIVRELLRHRVFSFANESTRYCNYSKDKFDNEITCVAPKWLDINNDEYSYEAFVDACRDAEGYYFALLKKGLSPQQAREVLPLCAKSELIMTGFEDDWRNFLDVRLDGITGKPHPDMIVLAQMIKDELDKIRNNES